ncbi:hypothetical protein FRZ44_46400 [Hypericibacter terrae]|uniref:Uncharacterized protein n=1 Tax=Hypericibacter terrae TaxID=2602015 RepID=A0A5J6MQD1_9PROT|nr:hypothetical protein FRZ44_46400 [Hypericibacter terrae]
MDALMRSMISAGPPAKRPPHIVLEPLLAAGLSAPLFLLVPLDAAGLSRLDFTVIGAEAWR